MGHLKLPKRLARQISQLCFFLFILLPQVPLFGQENVTTIQLPKELTGEWYGKQGGQFQFGLYGRGVLYQNQFWHYTGITQKGKKTQLSLKNDQGRTTVLLLQQNKRILRFYPSAGNPIFCLNNQSHCKIKHNLPVLGQPQFTTDSVRLNYFNLSPNGEQVSVQMHQLIPNLTSTSFMVVDKNGFAHFTIPVTNPVLLKVQLPYRRIPENILMLPGSDILLIQTGGRDIHYGGSGALLAGEFDPLAKLQNFGSDSGRLMSLLKGLNRSKKPAPADYKQLLTSIQKEQQTHIDSLFKARKISPLTYQIGKYNIKYAVAAALLHYTHNTSQLWGTTVNNEESSGPNNSFPKDYFDFLKALDNDSAFIAPGYWDFVQALRDPNAKADYPPLAQFSPQSADDLSIDDLCKLLLPLQHLANHLTTSQSTLLKNYQVLQNSEQKAKYISIHSDEIKGLGSRYYQLYIYNRLSDFLLEQFKANFGWQPGITTDLVVSGNLFLQLIGQGETNIPEDYFAGPNARFDNKFIGAHLSGQLQEARRLVQNATSTAGNSNSGKNSETYERYNNKEGWINVVKTDFVTCDTITKNGITLIFASNDPQFDPSIKDSMISVFFNVYPKEIAAFNPSSAKKVFFVIDSSCPLLAATVENVTRFQPRWFNTNPKDYDVITHEAMHIVQDYRKNGFEPRWLTEGIADYARQVYGLHNKEANWSLPPYSPGMHYTDSYRITARFLYWVQEHKDREFLKKVDKSLRDDTYTPSIWKERTGKDLDALWTEYTTKPAIDLNSTHTL